MLCFQRAVELSVASGLHVAEDLVESMQLWLRKRAASELANTHKDAGAWVAAHEASLSRAASWLSRIHTHSMPNSTTLSAHRFEAGTCGHTIRLTRAMHSSLKHSEQGARVT